MKSRLLRAAFLSSVLIAAFAINASRPTTVRADCPQPTCGSDIQIEAASFTPNPANAGGIVNVAVTIKQHGGMLWINNPCTLSDGSGCDGYLNDFLIDLPSNIPAVNDPNAPLQVIPESNPIYPLPCSYSATFLGSPNTIGCSVSAMPVGELGFFLGGMAYGQTETTYFSVVMPKDQTSFSMTVRLGHDMPSTVGPDRVFTLAVNHPDLAAQFSDPLSPPARVLAGLSFNYTATFANLGPGDTVDPVQAQIELPVDGLQTAGFNGLSGPGSCSYHHPTTIEHYRRVLCEFPPMKAGTSVSVSVSAVATTVPGTYQTVSTVDPLNNVGDNDGADNTASIDLTVYADATPPLVTGQASRAPDSNGWYNHPLSVAWSGTDPDDSSASLSCSTPTSFAGPDGGGVAINGHCTDPAGNTGNGTFLLNYDATKPSVTCQPADAAWHASDVTVACAASDSGSGLANPADASFTLTTNVPAGTDNGNASTNSRQICDVAGNCETAGPISGIRVDRSNPSISCGSADGAWHASDITIACTATDSASGLEFSSDASFTLSTSVADGAATNNALTNSRTVCDAVGNCATAGPIGGNMIDKAPPVLTCIQPDSPWHATDVAVACTASDAGAGLGNASDAAFSLTTSVAAGTETANASTNSHQVCDAVGNCAMAGPYSGLKVDKLAPAISCGSADGLWHQHDVTIGCSATDGGSGLASAADASFGLSTSGAAGTETANAPTGAHQVCDAVGNCATAGPIAGNRIDKAPPSIACGAADGIWHATDVSIGCAAADGGSGLATAADASFSLSTAVAAGTETANASTGSRSVCDAVGNCATAGPVAGNRIDKKAPVTTAAPAPVPAAPGSPTVQVDITKVTVTPGGSLGPITCWSTPAVVVNLAAADGGSGVASITYSISGAQATAATTAAGSQTAITVSKLGSSTITYFATDRVGNVEPARKLLVLNGSLLSCVTVPQAVITVPISGTANIVGTLTITYGPSTIVKPFNVTFPFNLTRD